MATVREIGVARDQSDDKIKPKESSNTLHYKVWTAEDELDAIKAVLADTPSTLPTATGDALELKDAVIVERISTSAFLVDAVYEHPDKEEKELKLHEYRLAFDTTGRTFTRKTSIEVGDQSYIDRGTSAILMGVFEGLFLKDFDGAINVATDGEVAGVEMITPQLRLQLTKKQPNAHIDLDFLLVLRDLTGTVNDGDFLGFEKGELLFQGCSGSNTTNINEKEIEIGVEITYNFDISKNKTNFAPYFLAKECRLKRGWEYIWIYFEEDEVLDGAGDVSAILPKPVQWVLSKIYEETDFKELMIEQNFGT